MSTLEVIFSKQKSRAGSRGPQLVMHAAIPQVLNETQYWPAGLSFEQVLDHVAQRVRQLAELTPPPVQIKLGTLPGPTDEQQLAFQRGFAIGLPATELQALRRAIEKCLPRLFQSV